MTPNTDRSPGTARSSLHWIIAVLILVMIPTGVVMARTPDDALRLYLYQLHLALGWTIVALSVWRLVLRVRRPVPAPPELAAWNRTLLHGVHWAVKVLPLLLAVTGMGTMLQKDLIPLIQAGEAPPVVVRRELEVLWWRGADGSAVAPRCGEPGRRSSVSETTQEEAQVGAVEGEGELPRRRYVAG